MSEDKELLFDCGTVALFMSRSEFLRRAFEISLACGALGDQLFGGFYNGFRFFCSF